MADDDDDDDYESYADIDALIEIYKDRPAVGLGVQVR